jgi:5-methylcytosine-specific restriction endonuclease McrA
MIKLSEEDLLRYNDSTPIHVKLMCMICMAFPEVAIQKGDTRIWHQLSNPVPSNRLCFHIKHELECPHCEFGVVPEEEIRERYFIDPIFRDSILKRDKYTCQACGYKQENKPPSITRRKKNENEAEYLYRRFMSSLGKSDQDRSLVVAHYSRRYEDETYENRHKMDNARTLCVDCHNAETAKHQMESWLERMKECPWLNKLE